MVTDSISWHVDLLHKGADYFVRLEFDGQPDMFEERGPFKEKDFALTVARELSDYVREALVRRLSAIRHVIMPRTP